MIMQHYSQDGWEFSRRRIPWIQIGVWVFLVGVSWSKLNSLERAHQEEQNVYARRDVLSVELKALGDKIDMQTERLRQLESQIGRLRSEFNALER